MFGKKVSNISKGKLVSTTVCSICGKSVRNVNCVMKYHTLRNVKSDTNIKDLFVCLLCQKYKNIHIANYCSVIKSHIRQSHRVRKPSPNVHYLDNTEKYKNLFQDLCKKCFPEFSICDQSIMQ